MYLPKFRLIDTWNIQTGEQKILFIGGEKSLAPQFPYVQNQLSLAQVLICVLAFCKGSDIIVMSNL